MLKPLQFMAAALGLLVGATAAGQTAGFPERPVTLVVPAAPGGGGDFVARLLADGLTRSFGRPFIVDNKAGAGGNIAAAYVARAQPDGHTLLLAYSGTHVANPALFSKLQWDPVKSFAPVALTVTAPHVVVVGKDLPATSLGEFVAHAKRHPGRIDYASSGTGTIQHVGAELLALRTGTEMVHVPYKGAGAAMTDLLSGQVGLIITTPPAVVGHIRTGALRALAIASRQRHPMLPDVPTTAEAGVSGVELDAWFALYAPAGTPQPVIDRLAEKIEALVQSPDFRRRAEEAGTYATFMGPKALDAFTRSELKHWSGVIRAVGIQVE